MDALSAEIRELKQEKRAVILAHTYQSADIQELADYVGDSYGLAVKASKLKDAERIVFCGVRFMAETAAILNPGKMVLMPEPTAGCPMADMITGEQLRRFKAEHPGAPVVCYVNSTAEVKAESTICCTSSNALKVVKSLGNVPEILFVPDRNLGHYVEQQLGRKLVLWDGFCPIHNGVQVAAIERARQQHPQAKLMVHPETQPQIQALADSVLSTGQMIDLATAEQGDAYVVGTEQGILHALQKALPQAKLYSVEPQLVCGDMKKITLEKLANCLKTDTTQVVVSEQIAADARKAIEAMLRVS